MKEIKRIVLTGGPCAGKTTALVKVIEYFTNLGYKVFTIPEVPTMFTQAGMDYLTQNHDFFYEGEKATLEIQLALEDKFMRMAETCTEPCVIVCDRGVMDISAYMRPEMWTDITSRLGTNSEELRNRYDAVLHLVSAADGAEQFYTTSNNAQRLEQADEAGLRVARELDKKVIRAWTGHPHLRVINNNVDFERKLNRVIKEIAKVLELPQLIETERKYIVEVIGELPDCTESEITQTYLVADPGCEVRIRRRSWKQSTVNIHTTRRTLSPTEELLTERQVSNNLYESLLQQADPYRQTIHKLRKSFIWQGQFFELDTYLSPISDLMILETKGMARHEDVKFPPFLRVKEDITGNTAYYNYNLALKR
ncbi:MAG: AAA family ATPase [Bacteroidaceae bacterium]|jgi:CYTH domain-containing protein/thymidylate kinase|nr:AAA family ATPase [Bacteroidaceae bacterium]